MAAPPANTGVPANTALIVAGPTASGKSALALGLAERHHGLIINADSMQVYRELRILTARPTEAEMNRVPHRLFGILSAAESCSVGQWQAWATAEIKRAWAMERLPIVVGGTGLYLRALTEGLTEVPPVPPEVRAAARALYAELGAEAFRDALAEMDAEAAARLPSSDPQRLIRAYEVVRATGRSLFAWQRDTPARAPLDACYRALTVLPPRADTHAACNIRLDAMIAAGAVDEVRALLARDLDPSLPAMKAVGVREFAAFVRGTCTLEQAATAAKTATRRLAKRQTTWLRHQFVADATIEEKFSERKSEKFFSIIRDLFLTSTA